MEKIVSNILDWDKGGLLSRGSNSIITKFNGQIYRINVFIDKAGTVLPGVLTCIILLIILIHI